MNNVDKELSRALTIEDLKNRVGKPVFVIATTEEFKNETRWYILSKINEFKANNKNCGYIEFTDCNYISLEKIQFFRFFDTEVTETELKEVLESEEKEKKTGYERVEGAKYYTVSSGLEVNSYDDIYEFDEEKYNIANYFNDKSLAENIVRAERLKYQLRRYAALNGGIPSQADWKNSHVAKYELIGESDNFIHATKNFESRAIGAVYFKDVNACEKAMAIFKDELIWYFTEFEEMLY